MKKKNVIWLFAHLCQGNEIAYIVLLKGNSISKVRIKLFKNKLWTHIQYKWVKDPEDQFDDVDLLTFHGSAGVEGITAARLSTTHNNASPQGFGILIL